MNALKKLAIFISLFAIVALPAAVARGDTVIGTNSVLDGNGGELFIPLQTSGVLNGVGTSVDSVTLTNTDSAMGMVEFVLTFDLSGALPGPLDIADPTSPAVFTFSFDDIDFKSVLFSAGGLDITYSESMLLTFLGDPADMPGTADLLIDSGNYLSFKTDADPETNNVFSSYEVSLQGDLGITDFSGVNDDKIFALHVKLISNHTTTGTGSVTIRNTEESFGAVFDFSTTVVPEPVTVALMGLGSLAMLWLRRKKR